MLLVAPCCVDTEACDSPGADVDADPVAVADDVVTSTKQIKIVHKRYVA